MSYRDRRTLNITLLVIIIVIVVIVTTSVIVSNAIINNWGFYEIFTAIGTALILIGGFGVYTTYAGGQAVSDIRLHARAPEVAMAEAKYARKRRNTTPFISFAIIAIAVIFLIIGLIGIT
ncbi:MAG: hypothetical protein JXA54_02710 [Candidatus Heimdallarchaeota archaeon]|nr:hypothetical protein [Candidatus Heimdallarchaeota archaeon]